MRRIIACLLIGILIVVFGCTTSQQTTTTNPQTAQITTNPQPNGLGTDTNIEISGFAFNPASITIQKGTTVIWTNKDNVQHTVTSDSGNELDSGLLGQGQSFTHTFNNAGTYTYHCTVHPNMKGTIVVE